MECATSCGGRGSLGHHQPGLGHQLEGHHQASGHSFGHAVSRQAKVCLCLSVVAVSFVCDSILRCVVAPCVTDVAGFKTMLHQSLHKYGKTNSQTYYTITPWRWLCHQNKMLTLEKGRTIDIAAQSIHKWQSRECEKC